MSEIEQPLYESAAVRELDRRAIEGGIDAAELMRRAAAAAWRIACDRWPRCRRLVVVCGSGNNGGDGYALAALAAAAGCTVQLVQFGAPPDSPAARAARAAWTPFGQPQPWPVAFDPLADLVVDAVLGIGLQRPVTGAMAAMLAAMNAHAAPILALDVPSGLDADTGRPRGAAVRAAVTVSFIAHKAGLWTGVAADYCGDRLLDTLGVPVDLAKAPGPRAWLMPLRIGPEALPPRRPAAHKGEHGHVLVVGGAPGMAGAALLASRAALRSGAGWVSLATHPDHSTALVAAQPELMVHAVNGADELQPLLARARVVVLGPGLGQNAWSQALFDTVLASGRPLVLDADGLNLLARRPQVLGGAVLTPHPGEAMRLMDAAAVDEVEADRFQSAEVLRDRFGAVVVLKGAGSVIAGRRLWVCPAGNPGMAVGGMGDVLSGIIGALMAQGLAPEAAAATGVLAHALAADAIARRRGGRGLLPSDVVDALWQPLNPGLR
ncbi:NAD(P)H-hydrate dehydratase [Flagellatimonas centrodinii]|uniref:NAD(P)H-hydrate dehydratase n=1 Tax=Flagellatimonas centrodinii TaxID=2806210 RepID=UPI001FED30F2|nr:NAD(P)H-hydrate dehydratase [Flagellatimonas centrodinii]ULQ45742.1 NAD(P)H-hydrate dehydratase [Flagellatimonas centrodinii]